VLKPNPEPAIIIAACTAAHRPTRRPAMLTDGRFDHTIGDGGFVLLVTMGDPPVGRTTAVARLGWCHRSGAGCPTPINVARPEYR